MAKLKKLFGSLNMTWAKVILFAVITAVYTALINQVPFLKDTSFRDIAVTLECWILFAMIIIMNCKKWWEASLKTFVFFLISQPLIYLIEVPFSSMGWGIFGYYKHWAVITVLTLPGAAIAFLVKKKNWLSVLVLSVANGYLAYAASDFFRSAISRFPYHLLSAVFCLALAVFFTFVFFDDKKHRIAALAIICVTLIAAFVIGGRDATHEITLPDSEKWEYELVDDSSIATVEIEGNKATIKSKHDGISYLRFINANGEEEIYSMTVSGGGITLNLMENTEYIDLGKGKWTYTVSGGDDIITVDIDENNVATLKTKQNGVCKLLFTDSKGNEIKYKVQTDMGYITFEEIKNK